MVVELHCHTSEFSACSTVNAIELIRRAHKLGMQAIVITDHHYQWNEKDIAAVKEEAGVPEIFHVLAGQEYKTSDFGDILIYGAEHTIKEKLLSLEEIRNRYPESAIIWAHPYRHNHTPTHERLLNPLHNGIEIFSSNYSISESARALKDWHSLKFTAIAGTDTHALSYTGSYPTIFDHPFSTIGEMVQEIKSGRCRPFFKQVPRKGTSDTEVTEVTIGPKSSKERKKIIVKTFADIEAWKEGERSYYIVKELIRNGFGEGKFRVSRPLDKDESSLSLMEEHVPGKTLYDVVCKAEASEAKNYLELAAGWLAKLHNQHLKVTPPNEYLVIEKDRLIYYLSLMHQENHPHTKRAQQILDGVWEAEQELIKSMPDKIVQSHGDFHLKNIYICKGK
jgi:3',5'-nucleoside bisphosphate phosphatase